MSEATEARATKIATKMSDTAMYHKAMCQQDTENLWLRLNASAFGQSPMLGEIQKTFGQSLVLEAVMCTEPVMNPTQDYNEASQTEKKQEKKAIQWDA